MSEGTFDKGSVDKEAQLQELMRRRAEIDPGLEGLYQAFEQAGEKLARAMAAKESAPAVANEAKEQLGSVTRQRLIERLPGGDVAMLCLYSLGQLIGGSMARGKVYRPVTEKDVHNAKVWHKERTEALKRSPQEVTDAEAELVQAEFNLKRGVLALTTDQQQELMDIGQAIQELKQ